MFDDIILMSEGRLVYFGPAKDEALQYFAEARWGPPTSDHAPMFFGGEPFLPRKSSSLVDFMPP